MGRALDVDGEVTSKVRRGSDTHSTYVYFPISWITCHQPYHINRDGS